jgi:hypothetical protein
LGKKITGASCEAYVFFLKTVPVIFFGALAKEWLLKCKTSFLPPNQDTLCFTALEINEMKQTKNWL